MTRWAWPGGSPGTAGSDDAESESFAFSISDSESRSLADTGAAGSKEIRSLALG